MFRRTFGNNYLSLSLFEIDMDTQHLVISNNSMLKPGIVLAFHPVSRDILKDGGELSSAVFFH